MKSLAILAALQTIVILFLAAKVIEIDGQMDASVPPGPASGTGSTDRRASLVHADRSIQYVTADQLRLLLREELAKHLGDGGRPASEQQWRDPSRAVDDADNQRRLESVARQIEYYKSIGSISPTEMHQLQMDIANLDQQGRRQMLNQLTKAMTAGEIDGEL